MMRPGSSFAILTVIGFFMFGCDTAASNVACVVHEDCGQDRCVNGLCIMDDERAQDTDDPDTDDRHTVSTEVEPEFVANLDVLFVVDNSNSMIQEQELLATSMYSFFFTLNEGLKEGTYIDTRMGIVSSDMGVSYDGGVYKEAEYQFDVSGCKGAGDAGKMRTRYLQNTIEVTLPVTPAKIECHQDGNDCPTGWVCTNMDLQNKGTCTPRHAYESKIIECPNPDLYTGDNLFLSPLVEKKEIATVDYSGFVEAGACLINMGVEGCNYEQPLAAIPAALTRSDQQSFLRSDALTLVIVITDEEDCSIGSDEWFEVEELGSVAANLACGRHRQLLQDVSDIRTKILDAKKKATGVNGEGSVLFAAIAGVPVGSVCEGRGDELGDCLDLRPGVNGSGTMANPDEVERPASNGTIQLFYEYACQRFEESNNGESDVVGTSAYPATRIVQMAQLFGERGYIYSICNADWTPIMTQLGEAVRQRLKITG